MIRCGKCIRGILRGVGSKFLFHLLNCIIDQQNELRKTISNFNLYNKPLGRAVHSLFDLICFMSSSGGQLSLQRCQAERTIGKMILIAF